MKYTESNRIFLDVIKIFAAVTGKELQEDNERANVMFFIERGWNVEDFDLVIKHHWNSPREKEFLLQPGNLNLRMLFNTDRAQRLTDILNDLRWMQKKKERDLADHSAGNKNKDGFLWDPEYKRWRAVEGAAHSIALQLVCGDSFILKQIYNLDKKRWVKENTFELESHYSFCPVCQQKFGTVATSR